MLFHIATCSFLDEFRTFEEEPQDITCYPGQNVTFDCFLNTNLSVDYVYFELGNVLAANHCNKSCEVCCSNSTLHLHTLTVQCEPKLVKEVVCIASNHDTSYRSRNATITYIGKALAYYNAWQEWFIHNFEVGWGI